jgi:hypothetical protein
MAYNLHLADRIQNFLIAKGIPNSEKKMMGGLCYMVDDKMCIGITGDKLMARIDPEIYEAALLKEGCNEMNFTGRPMRGFVHIEPEAIEKDEDLAEWIQLCVDYNPKAKSSKKRKKK